MSDARSRRVCNCSWLLQNSFRADEARLMLAREICWGLQICAVDFLQLVFYGLSSQTYSSFLSFTEVRN